MGVLRVRIINGRWGERKEGGQRIIFSNIRVNCSQTPFLNVI